MRLQATPLLLLCAALPISLASNQAFGGAGDGLRAEPGDADPVIYGGEPVDDCGFPTTVELNGCTGTLVHPRVVISAAHCFEGGGGGGTQVTFGDNFQSPQKTVGASCTPHPQFGFGAENDIAYCVLNEAVNDVQIVPILMGCGTDALTQGQEVAVVGFGQSDDNLGDGPKRQVFTTINSIANGEAFIGGNGLDSCYGDSGGPVYIPMADGSWRVFGVTSGGAECGSGGYYSMMHVNVGWVEQGAGYDVTPCHDANGSWNPGAECTSSPTAPHLGSGSWSGGCAGGSTKALEEVCQGGTVDGSGGDDGGDGGDGGTSTGDGGSEGGDGGTTTGGETATSGGESDTGGGDSSTGSGDSGTGSDSGGSGAEAGTGTSDTGFDLSDDGGEEGCACRASGGRSYGGWFGLALLLPLRRRRRR
jgi:hypothetical protein